MELSEKAKVQFWAKVLKVKGGCWEWQGYKLGHSGRFKQKGKFYYAHRTSYELTSGPIPEGASIRFSCGNFGCVNPEHLFLKLPQVKAIRRVRTEERLRFWSKVLKIEGGCWEWQAGKSDARGRFSSDGKIHYAHRKSYELTKGVIPDGTSIGFNCGNASCVNPEHLFLKLPKAKPVRHVVTAEERFWSKVLKKESGCWEWQGRKNNRGYGMFNANGQTETAHRFSYKLVNGPIPAGKIVRHTCDNPVCVNPPHLLLGTNKDNTWDMINRGRSTLRSNPKPKLK